jgi:hypothetical protein
MEDLTVKVRMVILTKCREAGRIKALMVSPQQILIRKLNIERAVGINNKTLITTIGSE